MRHASFAALLVAAPLAAAPLAAQQSSTPPAQPAAHAAHDPDKPAAGGVTAPGWTARFDKASAKAEQVTVAKMGSGLHVTTGPSGIFYDAKSTAKGDYTATATFTQTKASAHPEAYGLFVGGSNLEGEGQRYLYFVVRQDGKYTIKHRAGTEVHTLVDWTASPAVKAIADAGKATNALTVRAAGADVKFLVNGTEVASLPRAKAMDVDGIVGLRVNHNLDVHVDGFSVK